VEAQFPREQRAPADRRFDRRQVQRYIARPIVDAHVAERKIRVQPVPRRVDPADGHLLAIPSTSSRDVVPVGVDVRQHEVAQRENRRASRNQTRRAPRGERSTWIARSVRSSGSGAVAEMPSVIGGLIRGMRRNRPARYSAFRKRALAS